jgi:Mn2+/Fe2+ NRAMP family transporter
MQFYIQASTVDKGIGREQYGLARIDVLFGALLTGINAFFMIIVAGAVLFPAGIQVNDASDAARALGPLAGPSAQLLFAMGLFGASLLAATVMPLSTSYAICEAFGWESGISKNFRDAPVFMGLFTLLLVLGALVVLIPGLPLVPLILVSQNVNGLLLPVVLVFVLRLANDRNVMGDQRNGRFASLVGTATAVGASALSIALVVVTVLGI